MADFNQFGQNFGVNEPQSGNAAPNPAPENSVRESPGMGVGVRTMQSDMETFKTSGGVGSTPDIVKVPISIETDNASLPDGSSTSFNVGNGGGGAFMNGDDSNSTPPLETESSSKKKILLVVLVVLLALVLSAAGYFVVYPILFPNTSPPVVINVPPPAPVTPTPPKVEIPKHQSLLIIEAEENKELNLATIDPNSIHLAYLQTSSLRPASGSMEEVVMLGPGGIPLSASIFFGTLLPDFPIVNITQNLEDNFSNLLYFDTVGVWPVYIMKIKEGVILSNAETMMADIEKSTNFKNIYISEPGTPDPIWKSGQVGNKIARYLKFSMTGASLNYVWLGDYFVISTNYNGIKEASRRLGF